MLQMATLHVKAGQVVAAIPMMHVSQTGKYQQIPHIRAETFCEAFVAAHWQLLIPCVSPPECVWAATDSCTKAVARFKDGVKERTDASQNVIPTV